MSDVLLELVACETYRAQFPAGLPRRGCLRRQLETKREGKAWVPARLFCAVACGLGLDVATAARAAGVALGTCSGCGAALVGVESCETCAVEGRRAPSARTIARRRDGGPYTPKAAPVKLSGAPRSTLIWTGEVPDVPIGGPPATSPHAGYRPPPQAPFTMHDPELAARADRKRREAEANEQRVDAQEVASHATSPGKPGTTTTPDEPAQQQEETTMPGKPRTTPRPCCGSMSNRHCAGCKEAGKPADAKPTKKPIAAAPAPKPARAKKPAPQAPAPAAESFSVIPLEHLDDEDLAKSIAQCRAELQRRKLEARARFEKLEEIERSVSEAA